MHLISILALAAAAATSVLAAPQGHTTLPSSYSDPYEAQPPVDIDAPFERRAPGQLAPFLIPGGHEDQVVPGSYLVSLYEDYTLAEHFRFIGANLTTSDWCDEFEYFSTVKNLYHIKTKNETLVQETIRGDPGVKYVEADVVWSVPDEDGETGWGLGTP